MVKVFYLVVLGLFLMSTSFSLIKGGRNRNWRRLANCLQMGVSQQASLSSNDVLRFVRRQHYMIVPQSNPPTQQQIQRAPNRNTRSVGVQLQRVRCPFTYEVVDYIDTVPRFLSKASCVGCNSRCKPVRDVHTQAAVQEMQELLDVDAEDIRGCLCLVTGLKKCSM